MNKIKVVLYGPLMAGILLCVQGCSSLKMDYSMEIQQDKPEIEFELPEQVMELTLDLPIEITTENFATEASSEKDSSTETDSAQVQEIEVPDIYYTYHKLDNKKQSVSLTGKAYFEGDICPDIRIIKGGRLVCDGIEYEIHAGSKALNFDGSVNYTELELI